MTLAQVRTYFQTNFPSVPFGKTLKGAVDGLYQKWDDTHFKMVGPQGGIHWIGISPTVVPARVRVVSYGPKGPCVC